MAGEVAAIVCDGGEPLLERSLLSLRNQTVKPYIILCGGSKTDYELAGKLADKVLGPIEGIGKARVQGILEAETEYILSCDADTQYEKHYCEHALEDLQRAKAVKAGTILPLEWNDVLVPLETALTLIPPYEFCLGFRKDAILKAGVVEEMERYGDDKRWDIGGVVLRNLNVLPDLRLICWTRMPTKGAYEYSAKYLPQALAGAVPLAFVAGVAGVSEVLRLLH